MCYVAYGTSLVSRAPLSALSLAAHRRGVPPRCGTSRLRAEGLTFNHEMAGHSFDLNLTALSAGADDTWPNTTMVRGRLPPPPRRIALSGVQQQSLRIEFLDTNTNTNAKTNSDTSI